MSRSVNALLSHANPEIARNLEHDGARDPGQHRVVERVRANLAVEHAEHVGVRPFSDDAVANHERFHRAALGRGLFGEHVRQELDGLDVAAQPTDVGRRDRGGAARADIFGGMNRFAMAKTVGVVPAGGNWCVRGATPRVTSR